MICLCLCFRDHNLSYVYQTRTDVTYTAVIGPNLDYVQFERNTYGRVALRMFKLRFNDLT